MAIFETVFDAAYLIFVVSVGAAMLAMAKGRRQVTLFGAMAVVLGVGDAFHLAPRIAAMWIVDWQGGYAALGAGKLITSITMTAFYVLLYFVWKLRYRARDTAGLTAFVLALAAVRVALCLFPQNAWTSAQAPLSWGIYRNIPFALLGALTIVLFSRSAKAEGDRAFRHMGLAILLSFGFYIPVVLFADLFPPIGALMMPKTLAYVWIVWMGFRDMKEGGRAA